MSTKVPISSYRHGAVCVVRINNPPVNALSNEVRRGLIAAMTELNADPLTAAIVISGGPSQFIAGADIREMDLPPEPPYLPSVVDAIEATTKPVVAALEGAALGGGLEIALTCDARFASRSVKLGLPETRLGLIPGAGGTQRLPRLVGVAQAISLICSGKILSAEAALELGLLDEVVDGKVLEVALERATSLPKRRLSALPIPAGNPDEVKAAAAKALKEGKGEPAIRHAIDVIRASRELGFAAGVARERAAFLALRESPEAKALRHLFFAERNATNVPELKEVSARPLSRAAVIGAGTMGIGIAVALLDAGMDVTLVDQDEASAEVGAKRVRGLYDRPLKSGRLSDAGLAERMSRLTTTADWGHIADVDLAVEAAFEDMNVKTDIFRRMDAVIRRGTILATNTSYLDIDAIAAATQRPEDVIGLHFFAPAHVMRLLEVVRASATAPDVVASALSLAKKIGKQPVVAGNCDGFIGNRIYAVYRRHAEYLVEDGAAPEEVDAALEAYGFAMGIFTVSDLSGLDIAYAMRKRRSARRDPAERYVTIPDLLCEAGRLGRKTGAGWYAYRGEGERRPDPATREIIDRVRAQKRIHPRSFTPEEIQLRLLSVIVNEGAKILQEGIALRSSDIDLVFVNGYGFPRIKGGPMWAADQIGLTTILNEMERAHLVGGAGSEPALLLVELARMGKRLAEWGAPIRTTPGATT